MAVRRQVLAGVAAVAAALGCAVVAAAPATRSAAAITVGPLPAAPGTGLAQNDDYEPATAIDGGGTRWIAASIRQTAVTAKGSDTRELEVLSGADVWRSTDAGRSFTWVADPFSATGATPGLGGQDTDVAAAALPNDTGHFNVYVVSGWIPSVSVAMSSDGGATWQVFPLAGTAPIDDRPYIAADGACGFLVTYHALLQNETVVDRYNVCDATDAGIGQPLDPVGSSDVVLASAVAGSNRLGKPVVDTSQSRYAHRVYVPMLECAAADPSGQLANAQSNPSCAGPAEVVVAESGDGGRTFTDVHGPKIVDGRVPTWAVSAAVDGAGRVYITWSDDFHAYLTRSEDGGATWSAPTQLDAGPSTAVYPTVGAAGDGHVVVAWYGTGRDADANDVKALGAAGDAAAAPWRLVLSESQDAGRTWRAADAGLVVHRGQVCTLGTQCQDDSRAMFDNFGVVVDQKTGATTVAFMNDQPGGHIDDDRVMVMSSMPAQLVVKGRHHGRGPTRTA